MLIDGHIIMRAEPAHQILVAALHLVVEDDRLDAAVDGLHTFAGALKAALRLVLPGHQPLIGEAVRDAESLIAPARERSLGKVRLKVHAADAQEIVHRPAIIVEHMRQRAGKGAAGRVVIPAHRRAADLDIDHRHGKLRQKRRITVSVVDAGPVRRLGRNMVIIKTKIDAIALKGEQQVAHEARIGPAVVSGRHIAEGMDGEHVIRRVSALMPCHHAGHI